MTSSASQISENHGYHRFITPEDFEHKVKQQHPGAYIEKGSSFEPGGYHVAYDPKSGKEVGIYSKSEENAEIKSHPDEMFKHFASESVVDLLKEDYVSDFDTAVNPDTKVNKLRELMKSKHHTVVAAVAKHPSSTKGMLNMLALHDHPAVRLVVAQNPNAHETTHQMLCKDKSAAVRQCASRMCKTAERSAPMPVHSVTPDKLEDLDPGFLSEDVKFENINFFHGPFKVGDEVKVPYKPGGRKDDHSHHMGIIGHPSNMQKAYVHKIHDDGTISVISRHAAPGSIFNEKFKEHKFQPHEIEGSYNPHIHYGQDRYKTPGRVNKKDYHKFALHHAYGEGAPGGSLYLTAVHKGTGERHLLNSGYYDQLQRDFHPKKR